MKLFRLFLFLFILLATLAAQAKVFVVPIESEIDNRAARHFSLAQRQASEAGADILVVKLNTFGGALDAADSIRTALLRCPLPTVAFNMPSSDFSMTFAGMARHIMSPFADFRPRGNGGFHKTDAVRGK